MTARSTRRNILLGTALVLAVIIAAATGLTLWIINAPSGTRWALNTASRALDGAFRVRRIEGTLAGPLVLDELIYRDPVSQLEVAVRHVALDVEVRELLGKTVHVRDLDVRGVVVTLGPPLPEPPEPSQPFSLKPPLDILLDRLRLADAAVHRDGQPLVEIDTAAAAGAWTETGLDVRQFDVRSPQGEAHFRGTLDGDDVYAGEGRGRFRWRAGTRTYAGDLQAQARGSIATLKATLHGRVTIDAEVLQLERIHLAREQQTLKLDALIRPHQGTLRANGTVQLANEPVSAKLDLHWQDIVIPATLAGQILHTHGEMQFDGSAESYVATGAMRLGPPRRLADIRMDVAGSPQRVELRKLDVAQSAGELHATGQVDLQPSIAWQARARARHFNPGELAAAWPGDLNFELASEGRLVDQKPEATLQLENLTGRLRQRALRGSADLRISPDMVVAGTMDVRSGRSRVRVQGEHGAAMNARAIIEVPALDDWLPNAGGELQGQLTATGRWPALKLEGRVRGSSLRMAKSSVEAIALNFDVAEPKNPRGTITLDASGLAAGGLAFDTLRMRADADAGKHTLQLDANGRPLATHLRLHGAYTTREDAFSWSGTIEQLVFDVENAARLQLRKPFDIDYSADGVRVSQACLADRDIELCLAGNSEPSGALQAEYSLRRLPLGLANTFLPPSAPISVSGTLEGEGSIRRDAQGRLNGSAVLRSAHGEIARRLEPAADQPEILLKYDDLRLAARLNGSEGDGSVHARLNDTGVLQGELALTSLGEPSTNLRGKLDASLPSIAVVEMFAPQLANVQGQVQVRGSVAGTLDAPQLDGAVQLTNLATDVPALGLKLREGRFSVEPRPDGQFALTGTISSGKGALRVNGTASTAGEARIDAQGEQFLAADMPGAHVIIDPKLQLTRNPGRMSVQGEVRIPTAKIDLQKLPRAQSGQKISPDVVVIDARTQEEARSEALPLDAAVQIVLGKDVALAGFGLDAKVEGQLLVRETPGAPTTGSGEVRVAGTYKAYGQDLTIRQGQLLFAGTPLDNPRLSIVAVREIEPVSESGSVIAGLRVEGFARNPQLTVFSEPAMAQSNALSYLVTGKPLSDVGSGEGDAVQAAARSLGTAAGGLLAKNVGRRLGVDEVGIKDSEAIGGAALTVGQYLSPRLYLSYGVGLFEPGEVVTLRYKLSRKVAIEALNGPRDSRAGVEYRTER